MHVSTLAKFERLIAAAVGVVYLFAKLNPEDTSLRFHMTAIKEFNVTLTRNRLALVWVYLKSILNSCILYLSCHVLESEC